MRMGSLLPFLPGSTALMLDKIRHIAERAIFKNGIDRKISGAVVGGNKPLAHKINAQMTGPVAASGLMVNGCHGKWLAFKTECPHLSKPTITVFACFTSCIEPALVWMNGNEGRIGNACERALRCQCAL